jgi:hypothetical protein
MRQDMPRRQNPTTDSGLYYLSNPILSNAQFVSSVKS